MESAGSRNNKTPFSSELVRFLLVAMATIGGGERTQEIWVNPRGALCPLWFVGILQRWQKLPGVPGHDSNISIAHRQQNYVW